MTFASLLRRFEAAMLQGGDAGPYVERTAAHVCEFATWYRRAFGVSCAERSPSLLAALDYKEHLRRRGTPDALVDDRHRAVTLFLLWMAQLSPQALVKTTRRAFTPPPS